MGRTKINLILMPTRALTPHRPLPPLLAVIFHPPPSGHLPSTLLLVVVFHPPRGHPPPCGPPSSLFPLYFTYPCGQPLPLLSVRHMYKLYTHPPASDVSGEEG